MTMQSCGQIYWPQCLYSEVPVNGSLTNDTVTLDSTSDKAAWVGRAPFTDTITKVYFRTANVTTGADVDVRIETVGTDGRPSGTLWAANTNIVVTVDNADDNVWKTATLTSAASLTEGDEFAIVIATSAGTPSIGMSCINSNFRGGVGQYPTLWINATGSYEGLFSFASVPGYNWIVEFGTAGISYLSGLRPTDTGNLTAFNSGSSPDEYALKFQVPFKCRVIGLRVAMFNTAAAGSFSVSIWPSSSTTDSDALQQQSQDSDFAYSATIDGYVEIMFDGNVTLSPSTTYYAGVRSDSATNITVGSISVNGTGEPAGAMAALPLANSSQVMLSTRTWTTGSAGAWTDASTTFPLISLVIDQLDDGAGGGGLITHPGMSGGMRG